MYIFINVGGPRALCFPHAFSVASLPRASCFPLVFSVASLLRALQTNALHAHKNFQKSVSQSTWNALKRIEIQKKIFFYPFDSKCALRVGQSARIEAQPYLCLPHVSHRVPRSVHSKFHADWSKTVGAKGIHTDRRTHTHTHTQRQTDSPSFII